MAQKIVFTKMADYALDEYAPLPAKKAIPSWYRKTSPLMKEKRVPDETGGVPNTIKKCIPVLDSITAGYIIPTYADVYVEQKYDDQTGKTYPYYYWPIGNVVAFHPIAQAPFHPKQNGAAYPKWVNPWAISTPKGYSCLFTSPFHSDNSLFTVLDGIVDTDIYKSAVHFPFVLNDVTFEGLIPAGTPMVQVIPFKREEWNMSFGGEKEREEAEHIFKLNHTQWFDKYKRLFWSKKEFN